MFRYIKAMSFDNKVARKKIQGYDDVFTEHFIKIVIYGSVFPQFVDGWIGDISKAIYNISTVTSRSKLKKRDIYNNCFADFGDCSYGDTKANIIYYLNKLTKKSDEPYPEVEYSSVEIQKLSNMFDMFKTKLSEYLVENRREIDILEGKRFVEKIINQFS